jgi:hypothetical protein
MPPNNQVQAINEYDVNELMQDGGRRYAQLIQCNLPNGQLLEIDYDQQQHQIMLKEHHRDQYMYYLVAPEMRGKDLIRNFYGIRHFRLANIWRQIPRQEGDPRLMDLTFHQMRDLYGVLQFDVV